MAYVIDLDESNYASEALLAEVPVVIDFYADWCGPCQELLPLMEALADEYDGRAKICRLNVEHCHTLTQANKVMGVPTIFFMNEGEVEERVSSVLTMDELREKLNALL